MANKIRLSDHFTYGRLLRFTFPSILMMVFTSIYGVVDGIFVSNCAGKTQFAALNLIWPYIMMLGSVGYMLGTGGTALVAKVRGEGHGKKARTYFSMITYVAIAAGLTLSLAGMLTVRPVAAMLGAEGDMLAYAARYGTILFAGLPFFILQIVFQSFMVLAERPELGLRITVASGIANMVLDAVFVGWLHWGLEGAAAASVISQMVGSIWPLAFFADRKRMPLHLGRCRPESSPIIRSAVNGISELITNISVSLVAMLYNGQLLRLAGENGVAAYGVIMYVLMIFISIFFGYDIGVAPVISYHFGAGDRAELRGIRQKSVVIVAVTSLLMTVSAEIFASPLARIFVSYDEELLAMTVRAFRIYSLSFLLAPYSIFASAFFTALNDGVSSGLISFIRLFVFQTSTVMIIPVRFGLDGVWFSIVAAEALALAVTLAVLIGKRGKYGY